MKKIFLIISCVALQSCTISFQNISTHGTATDLIDENQAATANVKPVITIPVKPI